MKLCIATNNPGKIIEIKALLNGYPFDLMTLNDLGINLHPEENGTSYIENATIKALAFCHASQLPTLADDTGLEVVALDGQPGLFSARFSKIENARDADRRELLLENLAGKPRPWLARFICVAALALPDGGIFTTVGECYGEIISTERGKNGFGYDPIFLSPELGKTMAELSMLEKNRISHRALAVKAMIPKLISLI